MTTEVRPSTIRLRASRTRNSVSVSTLEVASSKINILGLCASARAKEISCFCPVDRGRSPLADLFCEAIRKSLYEVGEVHIFGSFFHVGIRNPFGAQADVAFHRSGEQEWILQNNAEAAAQFGYIHFLDVDAVDCDRSFLHVVETHEQRDDRGFACAGVSHDGGGFAGLDGEANVAENP